MEIEKKVVFKDAGRDKLAFGIVKFKKPFVIVTDKTGHTIYIHENQIILIKDRDGF